MKFCTKCGTQLVDDAVICTKCGCMAPKILKTSSKPVPQKTNKTEKEGSSPVLSFLDFVFSFLAITALFFVITGGKNFLAEEGAISAIVTSVFSLGVSISIFVMILKEKVEGERFLSAIIKIFMSFMLLIASILTFLN